MAQNTQAIFELVPTVKGVSFALADTTTKKTIQTGGTNGTRIDEILVSTSDTADVNLAFYINDGATDFYIGNLLIYAGSGYTTEPRTEAMATLCPTLGYLVLPYNNILKANCVASMTTGKITTVVAIGGDY
jgi:uncharacterized membrane protein